MSLTPREIEEIEAVANCLHTLVEPPRIGSVESYHLAIARKCASRLRALLPQPESLEEALDEILYHSTAVCTSVECKLEISNADVKRLRAALERRRKEQGK